MIQFGLASLMITSSRDENIGVVSGYPGTVVMAPGCESSAAFQSCSPEIHVTLTLLIGICETSSVYPF